MLMAAMPWGESDTRAKLIDPGLHACGWREDLIRREEPAGAGEIVDGRPRRRAKRRIDYTLRVKISEGSQRVAVALIEAKAENLPPAYGLEQGKAYAACRRLNVAFVFSSNGHMFVEFARSTGLTSPRPLDEFPTPAELRARYEQAVGFSLAAPASRPLVTRYAGEEEGTRRYYQDAAVRAVLEKLARGEKRALLSLATGAGKTRIAVTWPGSAGRGRAPSRSRARAGAGGPRRRLECVAERLVAEAPTIERFRACWIAPPERRELLGRLPDAGRSALLVRAPENMIDYDLYDVLAELGYGQAPRTREHRAEAFGYKHAGWLVGLPAPGAATLSALARQFARAGTDGLESPEVFQTPEVARAEGVSALRTLGRPADILRETKARLFAA